MFLQIASLKQQNQHLQSKLDKEQNRQRILSILLSGLKMNPDVGGPLLNGEREMERLSMQTMHEMLVQVGQCQLALSSELRKRAIDNTNATSTYWRIETCCICQDDTKMPNMALGCGHIYCSECIRHTPECAQCRVQIDSVLKLHNLVKD